jgi:ferrochelatase
MQTAILLMNLGSPDSPTTRDLKPYLTEFLMDERVIDIPKIPRSLLVKGIIVPFRSGKSAKKYQSIWTNEGSPLILHTRALQQELEKKRKEPIYMCMRYGNPSTAEVLKQMHKDHPDLKEIILVPLYPHYAMSSYETAVVQVEELHKAGKYSSRLHTIPPYYDYPAYIRALVATVQPYLNRPFDHILFSYHGVPERHIRKSDCTGSHCLKSPDCCQMASEAHTKCYRHQVIRTTELVAKELGLEPSKYSYSFQSRLGSDAWLKPYTAAQLKAFPNQGIKNLLVLCPAFVSDCLETLEEIAEEGREDFMKAGGQDFHMIPALNEEPLWIDCLMELIDRQLAIA